MDITNVLLNMWNKRMQEDYSEDYKDALRDCIYELHSLTDVKGDQDIEKYLDDQCKEYYEFLNADAYLSSIEAHEAV